MTTVHARRVSSVEENDKSAAAIQRHHSMWGGEDHPYFVLQPLSSDSPVPMQPVTDSSLVSGLPMQQPVTESSLALSLVDQSIAASLGELGGTECSVTAASTLRKSLAKLSPAQNKKVLDALKKIKRCRIALPEQLRGTSAEYNKDAGNKFLFIFDLARLSSSGILLAAVIRWKAGRIASKPILSYGHIEINGYAPSLPVNHSLKRSMSSQ